MTRRKQEGRHCFNLTCPNEPDGLRWFCGACEGRIHEASVRETARQAERKAGAMLAKMESPDIPVGPPDAADVAPPPPALGSSGASTRAIAHPSSPAAHIVHS
jgi:hypothetical protein